MFKAHLFRPTRQSYRRGCMFPVLVHALLRLFTGNFTIAMHHGNSKTDSKGAKTRARGLWDTRFHTVQFETG